MKIIHLAFSKKNQLRFINADKSKKKRLQKKCHELWRAIVLARANNKCEYPGCINTNQLNPHHVKTKGAYPHLKYEIDNGMALCSWHHTLGGYSAHLDINFKDIILGRLGGRPIRTEEWFKRLELKAQSKGPIDLVMMEIFLTKELEKYL
jgi:hypothetical protein